MTTTPIEYRSGWCHEPYAHGLCPGVALVPDTATIDGMAEMPCACECHLNRGGWDARRYRTEGADSASPATFGEATR